MANHFIKASFTLTVRDAEAEVLRRIEDAIQILDDRNLDNAARAQRYHDLGQGFAACFPPTEADPFGSFLEIFSDPDHPRLGFVLSVDPPNGSGQCSVWIHGDQVDVEVAANLIQDVAKSALPFGFEYAFDCDRMRVGEFGGGFAVIREDGMDFDGSARGLERALTRAATRADSGLVLAICEADDRLLFWNRDAGFGSFASATIFTEAEAENYTVPAAATQPIWFSMRRRASRPGDDQCAT